MTDALHKNALKLTLLYGAILAIVCIIFSYSLYTISLNEFERSVRRPIAPRGFSISQGEQFFIINRQEAIDEFRSRLIVRIILVNSLILAVGSGFAYLFARKTLAPIEAARQRMEHFTTDAAHDLRTPLAAMKIENEVLLSEDKITLKQAKGQLESNLEEVDRLSKMVESLLITLRDESENAEGLADVKEALHTAIRIMQPIADNKHIAIQAQDINETVGTKTTSQMLERAFIAILDNAVKYSYDNSSVEISTAMKANRLVISIKDQGIGLAKEDQKKVFDKLYRSDKARTKQASNGYGLGLYIAKQTIENAGGSIKLTSEVGKGTEVTIQFQKMV